MKKENKQILYASFEQRADLTTETASSQEYAFDIADVTYYVDGDGRSNVDVFEIENLTIFDDRLDDSKPIEATQAIIDELRNLWEDKFYDEIFDDYCNAKDREIYNDDYSY